MKMSIQSLKASSKKNNHRKLILATVPVGIALALAGHAASGATLYFDTNGTTSGLGAGSASTVFNWNAATEWATSSGGTTDQAWVNYDDAIFSQSSSTTISVTGSNVYADSLTFTSTPTFVFKNGGDTIFLANSATNPSNGGLTFNASGKYFFDSPLSAATQVLFTSASASGATIDLGGDLGGISATNTFTGGIAIGSLGTSGAMRVNFNSSGADGAGGVVNGNTITVNAPDSTLTTLSGLNNQEYDVNSQVDINPANYNPFNASTHPYGFLVSMGATTFSAAASTGFLVWKGQITGNGGVLLGNGNFTSGGGNAVTVFANSTNNYTGPTYIGSTGGSAGPNGTEVGNNAGSLRLGANNAVPATSDLIFGLPGVAKYYGNFDLAGYNDTVNSIQTPYYSGTELAMGITNSNIGQAGTSVLTIASTTDTSSTIHQFDSPIGAAAGNIGTQSLTGTQLASDNLAIVYNSPATLQLGYADTYTGGTTIQQGTIALADTANHLSGSLSPTGAIAFTGAGTLDLAGNNQTVGGLSSSGSYGTVTNYGGNSGGSSSFTVNIASASATTNFRGTIADGSATISLTKSGLGTVALGGANTYSGNTSVMAGTLLINGSTSATSAFTVASNAALGGTGTINGSVTVQTGGIVAPGGQAPLTVNSLAVQGGADLKFSLNGSAYDSVIVAQSGGLSFTGSSATAVDISGTPSVGTYNLISYGGGLTGSVSNLQLDPLPSGFSGHLALGTNAGTFTNGSSSTSSIDLVVTLYQGLTWQGGASQFWNSTDANWTSASSGNTYSDGSSVTFDDTGSGGTITVAPTAPATTVMPSEIIFNNLNKSYTISGAPIAGTTSLSILGGGSVALTGTNTFVGPINVSKGTLSFSSDANLGDSGNGITLGNAASQGTLVISGTFPSSRVLTLDNISTISVTGANNWTENGQINGGSGVLIKQGSGTLTLGGSGNSYGGSTTVSMGTLAASAINVVPSGSDLSVASGASFNTGGFNQTVGSISGAGGFILGAGSTLSAGGDNATTTVSGPITGGGTLAKNGTGTLTLSNTGNTFGGSQTVAVNAGTLVISSGSNLGAATNNLALADGSALALNTGSASLTSAQSISVATGPVGSATISFNTVNTSSTVTPTVSLNGQITGSGGLTISGPGIVAPVPGSSAVGVLTLGNTNNSFSGGLNINNAIITPAAGASLGSGTLTLANAILNLPSNDSTSDPITIGSLGATVNVPSGSFTFNGIVSGGQNTGVTKIGTGTLVLNGNPSTYNGAWNINAGTVEVASTDSAGGGNQSPLGTGGTTGGLVQNNSVDIKGGTLKLDVAVGLYDSNKFSPLIFMASGTLIGTGTASYGYDANPGSAMNPGNDDASGGLLIDRGTVSSPTSVTLATLNASDVFTIQNGIMQYDTTGTKQTTGVSNATITVSGPGTILLQSGTVNSGGTTNNGSSSTYAGSWNITSGILQLGPVVPDPNPLGEGGGPFGEPLDALGFVNGSPSAGNPVKISGGILAIGVDTPNENPNWTTGKPNAPDYLRASIELDGGSLASTGFETAYDTTTDANPQGVPTTTPVTAEIGGGLTIDAATTSSVLTYDPQDPSQSARSFEFVAGNLTWNGTLAVVAPTSGVGGALNFSATAGTVAVGSSAALTIAANSTVNVGEFLASGTGQTIAPVAEAIDPFTDSNTGHSVSATVSGTLNYAARTGTTSDTGIKAYQLNALTVQSGGQVIVDSAAASASAPLVPPPVAVNANRSVLGVSSLSIAGTGSIDLGSNDMIVHSGSGGELAFGPVSTPGTIENEVATGRGSNGAWVGNGIKSSAAAASPSNMALAAVINDTNQSGTLSTTPLMSTFDGVPVADGDILVKYTYYGDATLTGSVTAADYLQIDNAYSYNQAHPSTPLTGWYNGDFNYDGVINGDDYSLIDNAYNSQGSASFAGVSAGPANMIAGDTDQIAPAAVASPAVPEPGTFSLIGLGAVGLLARRRRRTS
jgi:autotransporter-associated beta strand protein